MRPRAGAALAALILASVAQAADAPPAAYPAGAAAFQANCAVCHGPAGGGVPSLAPPLTSYPARYALSAEGRRQLAMTVLYGLFGDIAVEGKHYASRMPDFGQLDDAALAAVLNFVVFDLGHAPAGVTPLAAANIAAERAHPEDGATVREHRKSVAPSDP
ncbi:MAG TPA: cytochrome c [Steroidobacteraceae bacterium]|nr:cytochrome c [Gammaproteobacteria bacterium]HEV2286499.1 cytochrome c [Steroidobacteraceae bacterium]